MRSCPVVMTASGTSIFIFLYTASSSTPELCGYCSVMISQKCDGINAQRNAGFLQFFLPDIAQLILGRLMYGPRLPSSPRVAVIRSTRHPAFTYFATVPPQLKDHRPDGQKTNNRRFIWVSYYHKHARIPQVWCYRCEGVMSYKLIKATRTISDTRGI